MANPELGMRPLKHFIKAENRLVLSLLPIQVIFELRICNLVVFLPKFSNQLQKLRRNHMVLFLSIP